MAHTLLGESRARGTAKLANLAPLYSREMLDVWFLLGSAVILFETLNLTYITFRIAFAGQDPLFKSHVNVLLIGINTFVLMLYSYFVVRALRRSNKTSGMCFF
jgi:heme/copper-type cytochrome/quinol oxidase subunit 3